MRLTNSLCVLVVCFLRQYICVDPRREGVPKDYHHGALFDDIDYMEARGRKDSSTDSSGPYGHGDHRLFTVEMQGSQSHYATNEDDCGQACDRSRNAADMANFKDGPGIPDHMEMGCAVCSIPAL